MTANQNLRYSACIEEYLAKCLAPNPFSGSEAQSCHCRFDLPLCVSGKDPSLREKLIKQHPCFMDVTKMPHSYKHGSTAY